MPLTPCPCGFTFISYSLSEYQQHERQHLATYPDADPITRANLRADIDTFTLYHPEERN